MFSSQLIKLTEVKFQAHPMEISRPRAMAAGNQVTGKAETPLPRKEEMIGEKRPYCCSPTFAWRMQKGGGA